jgi:hypothetical protein
MQVHVVNPRLGFGNVLIKLADFTRKAGVEGYIDESLKDFERGRAFNFNVKFVKGQEATMDGDIYCNGDSYKYLSRMLPVLMTPSQELIDRFNSKASLLEGVEMGIHVRCGSFMTDCKGLSASHGGDWFASNETFTTVRNIIHSCKDRVFLASDSRDVKNMFKNEFGDKIVTFDTEITLSCDPETCGGIDQNSYSLMDTYLEWFTLSKFRDIITTSGPGFDEKTGKGAGISTFGYTAAAYGQKPLHVIFWNGQVGRLGS